MASIFRRTKKQPIPEGAEFREKVIATPADSRKSGGLLTWKDRRGMTIEGRPVEGGGVATLTAYWSKAGRKATAPVSADGRHILRLSGPYIATWFDHRGKRRSQTTKTTDADAAERIARKHEADAALRRDGVIDAGAEEIQREANRTIEDHLADYEAKLKAANRTAEHIGRTLGFIRTIAEHGGAEKAGDLTADQVNRYAAKLADKGRAPRTVGAHLTAIKGFAKWLAEHGKIVRDPLATIRKPNPESGRRRERRAITPEEWQWLEVATLAGGERHGMTGQERRLLYRTAIQTGLRQNELRSLTRGRLHLTGETPYILAKARSAKNRRDCRQFIQPDLAAELQTLIARKSPKAPVFNLPDEYRCAAMIRQDLADAHAAWLREAKGDPQEYAKREESDFLATVNHDGERIDFHALRHTCGTWLAQATGDVRTVQAIMRHSTPVLTIDRYGHLMKGAEADAVAKMAGFIGAPATMAATGTDDADAGGTPPKKAQQKAQQLDRFTGQNHASDCGGNGGRKSTQVEKGEKNDRRNLLRIAELGEGSRDSATSYVNAEGGTRTRTEVTLRGILSPLRLPIPPLRLSRCLGLWVILLRRLPNS